MFPVVLIIWWYNSHVSVFKVTLRESCMTMLSVLVEAPGAPRMTMPHDDKMCNLLSIQAAIKRAHQLMTLSKA